MNPTLQGYSAAVIESISGDQAALTQFATDTRAVETLLVSNVELQSALTDTTVPGPARRAVLLDLLDQKVTPATRRAAAFAASAVPAPEVPVAINWLALQAHHAAEGTSEDASPLSFLSSRERVGGYATAVFEDQSTDSLEEVEDELFRFARTVDATPALKAALTDRELPVSVRQGVADQLLAAKVQPATLALVRYTLAGGRPRDFVGTLDWLVVQTAKARGWRVARIRAASEVDEAQRTLLSNSLGTLTGSPVELQVTIDPDLLSGVIVEVGDLRVDASARGRLDNLREHLSATGWEDKGLGQATRGSHEGAR